MYSLYNLKNLQEVIDVIDKTSNHFEWLSRRNCLPFSAESMWIICCLCHPYHGNEECPLLNLHCLLGMVVAIK